MAGIGFSVCGAFFGFSVEEWNNLLFGCGAICIWTPIEAAFLTSFGATPGKWLFSVWITDGFGAKLDFDQSFGRALTVLVTGLGFGIPIVAFITQMMAYGKLRDHGITTWDQRYGVVVRHGEIGAGRVLGIAATFLVVLILIGVGSLMN